MNIKFNTFVINTDLDKMNKENQYVMVGKELAMQIEQTTLHILAIMETKKKGDGMTNLNKDYYIQRCEEQQHMPDI